VPGSALVSRIRSIPTATSPTKEAISGTNADGATAGKAPSNDRYMG
jgi:hypothetical protein